MRHVLIAVVGAYLLSGCALRWEGGMNRLSADYPPGHKGHVSASAEPCSSGSLRSRIRCMERLERRSAEPEREPPSAPPARIAARSASRSFSGHPVAAAIMARIAERMPAVHNRFGGAYDGLRDAACSDGTLTVKNLTGNAFAEVRSVRIVPCDPDSFYAVRVLPRNGAGERMAVVIPPHGSGTYGFIADGTHRTLERYDVDFYKSNTSPAKWVAAFLNRSVPIGEVCQAACKWLDRTLTPYAINDAIHRHGGIHTWPR